jgi:hypothetical protein
MRAYPPHTVHPSLSSPPLLSSSPLLSPEPSSVQAWLQHCAVYNEKATWRVGRSERNEKLVEKKNLDGN